MSRKVKSVIQTRQFLRKEYNNYSSFFVSLVVNEANFIQMVWNVFKNAFLKVRPSLIVCAVINALDL